ncbi:MAG TPA: ABC transporter ATP-binding protein [Spirochaetales bacterium]|nr:ABC transporter ATP-binding protein [Spirochaetales bacterium]
MGFIDLKDITKRFGNNTVVQGLNLSVEKGSFMSFLGGSGCGKTTTLRMIAGFEIPTQGTILIEGKDVSNVPPARRNLGMVFQNYALFPNMTVWKNIAFGLKMAHLSKAETKKRVDEMLKLIHMEDFAERYPHQLSGGQQQRVALARALAVHPKALLLDEPLSALDAKIRVQLRDDIRAIQQQLGITTIYVTHDQEEAMSISDEIAVMRNGKIEQVGTPFEIYNNPATSYVASFIGTLNLLEGTVVDASRGIVDVNGTMIRTASAIKAENGAKVKLTVRPEALSVVQSAGTESAAVDSAAAEPAGPTQAATPTPTAGAALSAVNGVNVLQGSVDTVKFLGATIRFVLKFGETFMYMDRFNDPQLILPKKGDILTVAFPVDACKLLP